MFSQDDSVRMFSAWLAKSYPGSTINTYRAAIRLVFRHLGDQVSQASVDETFEMLRASPRYGAAKAAWKLFRQYGEEKGIWIPYGPPDARQGPRKPSHENPALPEPVMTVAQYLVRTLKLTCEDITKIRWSELTDDRIYVTVNSGAMVYDIEHPNGKRGYTVWLPVHSVQTLRDYARPGEHTPLIPAKPGSTLPFPLELILSEDSSKKGRPASYADRP